PSVWRDTLSPVTGSVDAVVELRSSNVDDVSKVSDVELPAIDDDVVDPPTDDVVEPLVVDVLEPLVDEPPPVVVVVPPVGTVHTSPLGSPPSAVNVIWEFQNLSPMPLMSAHAIPRL